MLNVENKEEIEKFLIENENLLRSIAKRFLFKTSKFSEEDLLQEARASAVKALQKFDSTKGTKAQTFIYTPVFRDLRDFVRKNKHDLYVTNYQQLKEYKENGAEEKTEEEEADVVLSDKMAVSLDKEITSSSGYYASLGDIIPSGSPPILDEMIRKEQIDILLGEMSELSEREQDILRGKFFEGKTYAEMGLHYNLTRQRIEQIGSKALNKLKEKVKSRLADELFV